MKTACYVYVKQSGSTRYTKTLGTIHAGEIPIRVNIEVPNENWKIAPIAEVNITYPTFVPTTPQGVTAEAEVVE